MRQHCALTSVLVLACLVAAMWPDTASAQTPVQITGARFGTNGEVTLTFAAAGGFRLAGACWNRSGQMEP